jgi:hypothetical protein
VNCNFTNATNPWLRLTTAGAPGWRNPVIDFARKLRFDLNADKSVKAGSGAIYRVQFKDNLGAAQWTNLVPDVTATGPTASFTDSSGIQQRFYRTLVLN